MKLEELVNKYKQEMNRTDEMIWHYIYNHKAICRRMSIYDMAAACNVSRTTILRFAKKLSLDGFSDLKAVLKMENHAPEAEAIHSIVDLCQRVGSEMTKKDFSKSNRLMFQAERIIAYGTGYVQKNVVNELKRLFINSGEMIYELKGQDEFKILLRNLSKRDLVILVSLSGESPQVVEIAETLRLKQIPVISITRLKDNALAALSEENIYITPFPVSLYMEEQVYESLIMYFLVVEIWFLQYNRYKKEQTEKIGAPAQDG